MKNQYTQNANEYISVLGKETGAGIIKTEIDYTTRNIKVIVLGHNIKKHELPSWKEKLNEYGLENTTLEIHQDEETSQLIDEINTIKSSYVKNQELIATKEETIAQKDERIRDLTDDLERIKKRHIPFLNISQEAKIIHSGLKAISFSNLIKTNFTTIDTIPVFHIQWNDSIPNTAAQEAQLKRWLKQRLELDSIQLFRYSELNKSNFTSEPIE